MSCPTSNPPRLDVLDVQYVDDVINEYGALFITFAAGQDAWLTGAVVYGLLLLGQDHLASTTERLRALIMQLSLSSVTSTEIRLIVSDVHQTAENYLHYAHNFLQFIQTTNTPATRTVPPESARYLFSELDDARRTLENMGHTHSIYGGNVGKLQTLSNLWVCKLSTAAEVGCWSVCELIVRARVET